MTKEKKLRTRNTIGKSVEVAEEPNVSMKTSSSLTKEELAVRNSLQRISINARRKAFRKNSPVAIIKNGKILLVQHNRTIKSLGVVKKMPIEVDINKPIIII